jgi:CARDB
MTHISHSLQGIEGFIMKRNVAVRALVRLTLIAIATASGISLAQPLGYLPGQDVQQPLPRFDPDRVRFAAPLPDLVITEASVLRMPVIDRYRWNKINFCVKNVGLGASAHGATIVFANSIIGDLGRVSPPRHPSEVLSRVVPALVPGSSYCDSLNILTKEGSFANFFEASASARLIVDRFRSVVESNETNNEFAALRISTR